MPPDDLIAFSEYMGRSEAVIAAVQKIRDCGFDPTNIHPITFDLIVGWIRDEVGARTIDLYLHFPNSEYLALSKCLLGDF